MSETRALHIIDTGLRSGRDNLALDQGSLMRCAQQPELALLRFYRSESCASVGRFQAIDRELRTDYCVQQPIPMLRRLSGGGALYHDADQLAFSLTIGRAGNYAFKLEDWLARSCAALAEALNRAGLHAQYKFPNDLEIYGRKIASVFATQEQGTLLLHGMVLYDADVKAMLEALRVPTEKLSRDGLAAARDRLATVSEHCAYPPDSQAMQQWIATTLARSFNFTPHSADAQDWPAAPAKALPAPDQIDWQDDGQAWLEALHKTAAGVMRVRARFDGDLTYLADIEFAADFQATLPELLAQLQRHLSGKPLGRLLIETGRFFSEHPVDMPGVVPQDFARALNLLLDKQASLRSMELSQQEGNALMVHSPENASAKDILARASVMLVPYCAKPNWCKWRHQDDCVECGLCEVGEAYRLARERNMRITTIMRYEHLEHTLNEMKHDGVQAYVGMCCGSFYLKRHRAFQDAGIPAVLMDINGATCYELKQEDLAYHGRFEAEATLNEPLLQKIMQHVPRLDHPTQDHKPAPLAGKQKRRRSEAKSR